MEQSGREGRGPEARLRAGVSDSRSWPGSCWRIMVRSLQNGRPIETLVDRLNHGRPHAILFGRVLERSKYNNHGPYTDTLFSL